MKGNLAAFASGGVFALGLALSGMTKPSKVLAFLDLRGSWDPSLAFVMVGAIAVHALARRMILKRRAPLFDQRFHAPDRTTIDARLVVGAAIFGVGWGLSGFCPGPLIATAGTGSLGAATYLAGMTLGMLAASPLMSASRPQRP